MQTRKPIVAGQFYAGQYEACVDEINECLSEAAIVESLPEVLVGGIVPHAGWVFSGSLAAMVFSAIKQQHDKVNTFIIFGAAHSYFDQTSALYDKGVWATPLGEIAVDEELAERLLSSGATVSSPAAHKSEHSIEVQVPFVQHLFPGAKILPVIVPPIQQAVKLGETIGEIIIAERKKKFICIGSTDLTHYGPRYGFTPVGMGKKAFKWASEVNDRQFIDLALKLEPQGMLTNAAENGNACGAGAAAAAAAVAKKLGKTKGILLAHTNSNEVMTRKMGSSGQDSVGYAAIVF